MNFRCNFSIIEIGDSMKTIERNLTKERIVQKSRFITLLIRVYHKEDVRKAIADAKEKYPAATHYTYAYVLDTDMHASDDGEPSGTAGNPILNVLIKQDLHFLLAIVIRYFGGIKLGAGGLVRAYSGSIRNTLDEARIIELEPGYVIKIQYDYQDSKRMNQLLENLEITEKTFTESIEVVAKGNQLDIKNLQENNVNYEVIGNTYIKKKTN